MGNMCGSRASQFCCPMRGRRSYIMQRFLSPQLTNASISRTRSFSAPCSINSIRAILLSVIITFSRFGFASAPAQKIGGT